MPKIVVVDDDRGTCLLISAALKRDGRQIFTAYDAMGGFTLVMRERPDLLILDLSMPAGGGFSIADRMRRIPALAQIPILVITATDDPIQRTRAEEIGAVAFVLKPIDAVELRRVVDTACGLNDTPR
jgi:CheY-like chemotaxis protein